MNFPYGLNVRTYHLPRNDPRIGGSPTRSRPTRISSDNLGPFAHLNISATASQYSSRTSSRHSSRSFVPGARHHLAPLVVPGVPALGYVQAVEESERAVIQFHEVRETELLVWKLRRLYERASEATKEQTRLRAAIHEENVNGALTDEHRGRREIHASEMHARRDLTAREQRQREGAQQSAERNLPQPAEDALPVLRAEEHAESLEVIRNDRYEEVLEALRAEEYEDAMEILHDRECAQAVEALRAEEHENAMGTLLDEDYEEVLGALRAEEYEDAMEILHDRECEQAVEALRAEEHEEALQILHDGESEEAHEIGERDGTPPPLVSASRHKAATLWVDALLSECMTNDRAARSNPEADHSAAPPGRKEEEEAVPPRNFALQASAESRRELATGWVDALLAECSARPLTVAPSEDDKVVEEATAAASPSEDKRRAMATLLVDSVFAECAGATEPRERAQPTSEPYVKEDETVTGVHAHSHNAVQPAITTPESAETTSTPLVEETNGVVHSYANAAGTGVTTDVDAEGNETEERRKTATKFVDDVFLSALNKYHKRPSRRPASGRQVA